MYTLYREQIVQTTLEDAWAYLNSPKNLNKITPDFLDFTILTDLPETMHNGLLIEYKIKIPALGTQRWLTEIKHIRPPYAFVDEQRKGPYKFWYHYHGLEDTGQGIKLIDRVTYQVPFGFLGRIVHALVIKKMLIRIFDYRATMFETQLSRTPTEITTA